MQLYIRRNGERFGPYSREAVIEYLKQDIFREHDEACYAGTPEWRPLREILGVSAVRPLGRGIELAQTRKITAFNPNWSDPRPAPHAALEPRSRLGMAAVGILSAVIVLGFIGVRLTGGTDRVRKYFVALAARSAGASAFAPALLAATPEASATPLPKPVAVASPRPAATAYPATTPVFTATPLPVVATTPLPVVAATPLPSATPEVTAPARQLAAAAPAPFDPAALAADPASWPKTVHLEYPVKFPLKLNSEIVGTVTAPRGVGVSLLKIEGNQLTVGFDGATQVISWHITDLEEQAAKSRTAPSAAPPPSNDDGGIPIPPH